jgi:hypothetical protein
MNYDIKRKDGNIYITVNIDDSGTYANPKPRERIMKSDIKKILASENIQHEGCIENPEPLSNFENNTGALTKTWVFCAPKPKPKPKPKPRSTTTIKKKTKK